MTITGRLANLTADEVSAEIEALDIKYKEDRQWTTKTYRSTRKRLTALLRVLQEEQGEPEDIEADDDDTSV